MNKNIIEISVLVPAFNESKNLKILTKQIYESFKKSKFKNIYEIIIINDGSNDDTNSIGTDLLKIYKNLKIKYLKENYGKGYAMDMGIQNAKGFIIATIDADLQYSSSNLIEMINMIYNGDDLVNGRRIFRKDDAFSIFFSRIYNLLIRTFFSIKLKDFFSGIKVYKKEIYNLMDYAGMARFIVFYSKIYNYKINEYKVDHFHRKYGKTSYNFYNKIYLSIKDIFSLIFCIYLGKKGFYHFKQFIFSIYFFIFIFFLITSDVDNIYFILTFVSLIPFIILNFIVTAFLESKSNKKENLIKNILM